MADAIANPISGRKQVFIFHIYSDCRNSPAKNYRKETKNWKEKK